MVLIANTRKYKEGLTKKVISEQGHLDIWRRAFQAERMTCASALGWEQTQMLENNQGANVLRKE